MVRLVTFQKCFNAELPDIHKSSGLKGKKWASMLLHSTQPPHHSSDFSLLNPKKFEKLKLKCLPKTIFQTKKIIIKNKIN